LPAPAADGYDSRPHRGRNEPPEKASAAETMVHRAEQPAGKPVHAVKSPDQEGKDPPRRPSEHPSGCPAPAEPGHPSEDIFVLKEIRVGAAVIVSPGPDTVAIDRKHPVDRPPVPAGRQVDDDVAGLDPIAVRHVQKITRP